MLCAFAASAYASPLTDPTAGRAVFTGAVTGNATSIEINPAAVGMGPARAEELKDKPNELYFAAIGTLDRIAIDRRTLDIDTGALGPGASVTSYLPSAGGTIAGIWHTGDDDRITLFAQIHSAPGERFIENEALRYHTAGGYHRTVSAWLGGSIRFTRRFYFGASVGSRNTYLKLRYARDTALEAARDPGRGVASDCGGAPCGVENPQAEERYEITTAADVFSDNPFDNTFSVNLGAVLRLGRDTYIGVGYHVPAFPIETELTGRADIQRAPRDGGERLKGGATVFISQSASIDLAVRARLPRLLDLHVGTRWQDFSRFKYYDVRTYGSTLPPNGIPEWQLRPRGFHDTFALWAGVEQVEHDSPLVLGGRLGIERGALDADRTSPLSISPTSLTADVGLQYRFGTQIVLQATYGLTYFPGVDVTDSAYDPRAQLACSDASFNYDTPACATVRAGYAIPTAAGDYRRFQQAMRLAIRYELP